MRSDFILFFLNARILPFHKTKTETDHQKICWILVHHKPKSSCTYSVQCTTVFCVDSTLKRDKKAGHNIPRIPLNLCSPGSTVEAQIVCRGEALVVATVVATVRGKKCQNA